MRAPEVTAKRASNGNADVATPADVLPQADTSDPVYAPDPEGDPTGMFAGETDQDLREESAGRTALEQALPGEPGSWKTSGAVPDHDPTPSG